MRNEPRDQRFGTGVLPITDTALEELHQGKITDSSAILALLDRLALAKVRLRRALNRKILPETAIIERIDSDGLVLRTFDFDVRTASLAHWGLSGALHGSPYYFVVPRYEQISDERFHVGIPPIVYQSERRDRIRTVTDRSTRGPKRVLMRSVCGVESESEVADYSPGGLGLIVSSRGLEQVGELETIKYLDGPEAGETAMAEIRNSANLTSRAGWTRVGVSVRRVRIERDLPVERHASLMQGSTLARAANRAAIAASTVRAMSSGWRRMRTDEPVKIVDYFNREGERIRGILDYCGEHRGAPVVIIPPAWGKTKETLLPLAQTIVASFRKVGRSIVVLRFDGVRRKGESFNDSDCRYPGRECHRFTFSQGVKDIGATIEYVFGASGLNPSGAVLLSFSAASVDCRRAVADEREGRLSGWISVVGAPDLQSAMRVVSGGIDYVGGRERGIRFGIQEIQGVAIDMDHAASDALANRLGFLEDALEDMASIDVPVTWIHGLYDAWMDFERVRMLMGAGDTSKRRLLQVPTGHQLRSSTEAIQVFQFIAAEIGRMVGAPSVQGTVPSLSNLRRRARTERARLPKPRFEPRQFWRDYLVGRGEHLGIELMTSTSAYRDLMNRQVEALALEEGQRIADLGSGTGSLSGFLLERARTVPLTITELDCVVDALKKSRGRVFGRDDSSAIRVASVVCDLDLRDSALQVPIADEMVDSVLASLLISYLTHPDRVLNEVRRILRPGGRLVVSTLRPDADTSRIYQDGADELRSGRARVLFGERYDSRLSESLNSFINDAARLLELEEQAIFKFFDEAELRSLLETAGFDVLEMRRAFGEPPQAIVVAARKAPDRGRPDGIAKGGSRLGRLRLGGSRRLAQGRS